MNQEGEKVKDESSAGIADSIQEIRQEHYAKLAREHSLTVVEIQEIHESTLARLASAAPKFQMYIEIALPKAIEEYKNGKLLE
jgi:hypothetical protein